MRAGKRARWIKALTVKTEELSSVLGTYKV